jgi:hypothetical protein
MQEYIPSAACLSFKGVPLRVLEKIRLVLSLSLSLYRYILIYSVYCSDFFMGVVGGDFLLRKTLKKVEKRSCFEIC